MNQRLAAIFCLGVIPLSSCLIRRRVVVPAGQHENRPLLSATKDELIQRIRNLSDAIQSFTIKADMTASVGNLYGGQVTDYATITGFILFQKPEDIRVIGQDPVIHSTAFDMVSTGNDFRVSIPVKSLFIKGQNDAPAISKNKLENLRPVAFRSALMIYPPAPSDLTLLENDTNESKAVYIVMMVRRDGDELRLVRFVYFDRYTLQIARQKTFDAVGSATSDTKYSDWKPYNGISFPSAIDMQRPQEGYELVLSITEMKINTPTVTPEKFVLNQPPGSQLKEMK